MGLFVALGPTPIVTDGRQRLSRRPFPRDRPDSALGDQRARESLIGWRAARVGEWGRWCPIDRAALLLATVRPGWA